MLSRLLILVSVAASVTYLFTGNAAVKGCAVGALAVAALAMRANLLALALALSAVGDVVLDLGERWFAAGLAAFLLAHVTYICLFVRKRAGWAGLDWRYWAGVAAVVIYSVSLSVWIVPSAGPLAIPVVLYVCALTTMVATAILGRFRTPWVVIGAVLFLISDSLLAIDRFKTAIPWRGLFVWSTYYLGQFGIWAGQRGKN